MPISRSKWGLSLTVCCLKFTCWVKGMLNNIRHCYFNVIKSTNLFCFTTVSSRRCIVLKIWSLWQNSDCGCRFLLSYSELLDKLLSPGSIVGCYQTLRVESGILCVQLTVKIYPRYIYTCFWILEVCKFLIVKQNPIFYISELANLLFSFIRNCLLVLQDDLEIQSQLSSGIIKVTLFSYSIVMFLWCKHDKDSWPATGLLGP